MIITRAEVEGVAIFSSWFGLAISTRMIVSSPADAVVAVAKIVDPDPAFSKKVESGFGGSERCIPAKMP